VLRAAVQPEHHGHNDQRSASQCPPVLIGADTGGQEKLLTVEECLRECAS
jgi:hypothetical protein